MKNIHNTLPTEKFGLAISETYKKKPGKTLVYLIAAVAAVALAILFAAAVSFYLPLSLACAIAVPVAVSSLTLSSLFSWLLSEKIKDSLFHQFKKAHTVDKVSKQSVVLILEANEDHNGAFEQDQRKLFKRIENKYAIAFKKVSSIEDIQKGIEQTLSQNNRIKAIWFRAHGNPETMRLSKTSTINKWNVHRIAILLRKIDPQGSIILDSCKTGAKHPKGERNIAEQIASLTPNRRVIAPLKNITASSLKSSKSHPLDIKIWTPRPSSKHRMWKGVSSFINDLKFDIFHLARGKGAFRRFAFDATKIYQKKAPLTFCSSLHFFTLPPLKTMHTPPGELQLQ